MTNVLPQGEDLRRATRWITEERAAHPEKTVKELIDGACMQFDLSPLDAEFVERFVRDKLFK